MNLVFFAVFGVILIIYSFLNYYIGLRVWQSLGIFVPFLNSRVYWSFFWLLVFAYIIGRVSKNFLPYAVSYSLTQVGSYWLAAMVYFTMAYLLIDIVSFLGKKAGINLLDFKAGPGVGIAVLLFVVGVILFGSWSARSPRNVEYDVMINKPGNKVNSINVVMVSDIHLGTIIHNGRLVNMVNRINELNPDIILLPGDVIDENIQYFIEQNMSETFSRLNPPLGIYAVMGNHEYIGGHADEIAVHLAEAGVVVLRDEVVLVNDSFYIIGREDRDSQRFTGQSRKSIKELMAHVDPSLPLILLDHQPNNLSEHKKAGIDLQVSGHTHRGQLFPFHLITGRIFEIDWGHLQDGDYNIIVSSGYGTWGPPIRVGHRSEIVKINIQFQ
ncbi:metallophosphoesterase [Geosporobacter ferrireducens]|uniref:Metallophosphoesterase n=1 Tax=Geosporobacter ferrireducens TaxID=1424294 RepID=A0A1D8GF19_9FIRM|nr:metallophosphoesterase [Geosporobacter ferrireducens]AOT69507.1 metallophosphoesterase [Geosporobacter ferrireducens]